MKPNLWSVLPMLYIIWQKIEVQFGVMDQVWHPVTKERRDGHRQPWTLFTFCHLYPQLFVDRFCLITIVRWQHLPLFTYERMHVEDRRLVCICVYVKCVMSGTLQIDDGLYMSKGIIQFRYFPLILLVFEGNWHVYQQQVNNVVFSSWNTQIWDYKQRLSAL